MTKRNPSAAVAATLGKAKSLGLMVDRKKNGAPGKFDVAARIVPRWKENLAKLNAEDVKEAPKVSLLPLREITPLD